MSLRTLFILAFIFCFGWLNAQLEGTFHFIANVEQPSESIFYYLLEEEEIAGDENTYFKVYTNGRMEGPAVYGSYLIESNRLIFYPFYGWSAGQKYTAIWKRNEESIKRLEFTVPQKNSIPPELINLYPTSDTLPANQLKLYLQFSNPMALGYVYEMVEVYDDQGQLLDQPFLELQPELWNPSGKQICLWFDPGRLKRDLNPNLELGTPLEEGKYYRLVLKKNWPDRVGKFLHQSFEKTFFVGAADRSKPVANHWKVLAPKHQEDALQIEFRETMDASILNKIEVLDSEGNLVIGNPELQLNEKSWIFHPIKSWKKGSYKIRMDAKLEDLAGNNLNRLFDRDLLDQNQQPGLEAFYWLMFEIR